MMSGPDWLAIRSGEMSAEIDPLGAQLSVLRDHAGRDLLWNGDATVWAGRAPLLFPIVGELAGGAYRLGSTSYPLPRHGFARGRRFGVLDSDAGSAVFRLQADEGTLAVYPFRFQLDVHYVLDGPTLSITTWVRNLGDRDMPASFGYHPAFRWPLSALGGPRSAHFIEFTAEEPGPVRRLDAAGLLSPEHHASPIAARRLALDDALFKEDVLILEAVRSQSVTYGAGTGPRIRIDFPDTPSLGLWTKPGAPFICIEPWHGFADPAGYDGDFTAKPGVFIVGPRAGQAMRMSFTLTA
jgi:galactose mutarotase-like enzyme